MNLLAGCVSAPVHINVKKHTSQNESDAHRDKLCVSAHLSTGRWLLAVVPSTRGEPSRISRCHFAFGLTANLKDVHGKESGPMQALTIGMTNYRRLRAA